MKNVFTMFLNEHLTRLSSANNQAGSLFLVLFFLVTGVLQLSAQQNQPVLFHGVILDNSTLQPLAGARYDVNGRIAGAADDKGMISVSPLMIIPLIYILSEGLPGEPAPPSPYISPREMHRIQALHDSLIYKGNRH